MIIQLIPIKSKLQSHVPAISVELYRDLKKSFSVDDAIVIGGNIWQSVLIDAVRIFNINNLQ